MLFVKLLIPGSPNTLPPSIQFKKGCPVMLCPKCKNKVLGGGSVCSHCGYNMQRKWYQKNSPLTIMIMIGALIFLGFAIWFSLDIMNGDTAKEPGQSGTITMEQFTRVEQGMTYEQVIEIFGSGGKLFSEAGEKGTDYYTVVYTWEGKAIGSSASFTFQNNKLTTKVQIGLS